MEIEKNQKIVVRFAPSPTGNLHLGGARTALFNCLFAQKLGGRTILRIEDTDKERSKQEFENNIHESLDWLGLNFDEKYKQSERAHIYRKYLERIISDGSAYISEEPSNNNPNIILKLVRLKNTGRKIVFNDIVRGNIEFDTAELGDFIIAKDISTALYHFAVVVDDYEMNVSHIIRGEDHISNTPRQILIQEAIGAIRPLYAHIPLILAPDRTKLSKRHGAVTVTECRDAGFLPSALLNQLALLGWNHGGDQEIFTLKALVEHFSIEHIQKSGAIFDQEKLRWFNREHIKKLSSLEFLKIVEQWITPDLQKSSAYTSDILVKLEPLLREKVSVFSDIETIIRQGDLDYFFSDPQYEWQGLTNASKIDITKVKAHLASIIEMLKNVEEENFSAENVKHAVWEYASNNGKGDVLWPMRYALCGKNKSPDPFVIAGIIGKEKALNRLQSAIHKINLDAPK